MLQLYLQFFFRPFFRTRSNQMNMEKLNSMKSEVSIKQIKYGRIEFVMEELNLMKSKLDRTKWMEELNLSRKNWIRWSQNLIKQNEYGRIDFVMEELNSMKSKLDQTKLNECGRIEFIVEDLIFFRSDQPISGSIPI